MKKLFNKNWLQLMRLSKNNIEFELNKQVKQIELKTQKRKNLRLKIYNSFMEHGKIELKKMNKELKKLNTQIYETN